MLGLDTVICVIVTLALVYLIYQILKGVSLIHHERFFVRALKPRPRIYPQWSYGESHRNELARQRLGSGWSYSSRGVSDSYRRVPTRPPAYDDRNNRLVPGDRIDGLARHASGGSNGPDIDVNNNRNESLNTRTEPCPSLAGSTEATQGFTPVITDINNGQECSMTRTSSRFSLVEPEPNTE